MDDYKYIKVEPLEVKKIRHLKELAHNLDKMLNEEEFLLIVAVYGKCINRLEKQIEEVNKIGI